jgi:hypothetical protein
MAGLFRGTSSWFDDMPGDAGMKRIEKGDEAEAMYAGETR